MYVNYSDTILIVYYQSILIYIFIYIYIYILYIYIRHIYSNITKLPTIYITQKVGNYWV